MSRTIFAERSVAVAESREAGCDNLSQGIVSRSQDRGSFHVKTPPRSAKRRRDILSQIYHHLPHPYGRAEIYRESRILSIGHSVAGKFRPKKKRRGQGNKKLCRLFQFIGGGKIKLSPSYFQPCSLISRPLSPSYSLRTFDLASRTI